VVDLDDPMDVELDQARAGWTREHWGSAGVSPEIPPVAAEFLRWQRMIFIGAVDALNGVLTLVVAHDVLLFLWGAGGWGGAATPKGG
jgi:hypothetical protein